MRTTLAVLCLIGLLPLAGCLGESTPDGARDVGTSPNVSTASVDALWNGSSRIVILESETSSDAKFADVLCIFGGAPRLERNPGAHVLPGTDHLKVTVEISETYTGVETGWVLDGNGAQHASDVDKTIHWLPTVEPGGEQTFTVPVASNQTEAPGGENRWDFYERIQPPEAPDEACYTGVGYGESLTRVVAVRGS